MKLKIIFDSQIFFLQKFGGISRYFAEINSILNKEKKSLIVSPFYVNEYVAPSEVLGRKTHVENKLLIKLLRLANKIISELYVLFFKVDIIHETYFSRLVINSSRAKRIITVYDMIHERYPDEFGFNSKTSALKKKAVDKADHVICISESTKNDLIEIFGVCESKISVVYLAASSLGIEYKYSHIDVDKPYLLYVGNRNGYKNFEGFVKAFSRSSYLKENYQIYCFGGGDFNERELSLIFELGLNLEHFRIFFGGDDILNSLYNQATAFIYPSIYEGFGIPPLEAMANNCPVISSNSSSMPEIIGDAGLFFAPDCIDEIQQKIEELVFNPNLRDELILRGRERVKEFSWDKCARDTYKIYEKVIRSE